MESLELNLRQVTKYRPWLDKFGKSFCLFLREDGVYEAVPSETQAILTKEEFVELDRVVLSEYRKHTPTIQFLMKGNLVLEMPKIPLEGIPLEYQEPVSPIFKLTSIPLPITHVDFASPKEATSAAETLGKLLEKTLVDELKSKAVSLEELTGARFQEVKIIPEAYLQSKCFYGPYHTVDGVMFHARPDTIRLVIALHLTTIQWEGRFKLLTIMVPQIRANYQGLYGIVHV